ncbi:hypothetical protein D8M05_18285 [Oceanobacillus bengalensis]|uniref:Uncharacterized protein n=1 Tax=Oceanobacillus bengalensis TaxID=1435466 RepID=A0A494YRX8_9BACI|nr:hypothetical protein D8M05_18285 [Oceanobacillus bengalensis]
MYPISLFIIGIIGFLISILFTIYIFKKNNVKGKATLPSLFMLISTLCYLLFYAFGIFELSYTISISILIFAFLFTLVSFVSNLLLLKNK